MTTMNQSMLLRFAASLMSVQSVLSLLASTALANPYLPKPGEGPLRARVGTCSITGTIIHLSTALDHGIFEKYGLRMEHIAFRGSSVTLAASGADEIQFLNCAASATLPGLSTGVEAKYIGSQLVGLPWFMLGRKEIRTPLDLKGRAIGITRVGDLTHRLALEVLKKFNLSPQEVKLQPVGGSGQLEPYNAMSAGVVQAVLVSPPLSKPLKLNDPKRCNPPTMPSRKLSANRRLTVPMNSIEEMIEQAREAGTQTRRRQSVRRRPCQKRILDRAVG